MEGDKDAPRPLRQAFSRRYHMLQRMIGECVTSKRVLQSSVEVVQWAVSLDPDPARAFKRAKALRSQFQDLMSEFPGLEQLRACDEELNDLITTGVDAFKSDASRKTPPAPTQVRKPEVSSQVATKLPAETEEVEPAMGVSDLLDEALRDIEAA